MAKKKQKIISLSDCSKCGSSIKKDDTLYCILRLFNSEELKASAIVTQQECNWFGEKR